MAGMDGGFSAGPSRGDESLQNGQMNILGKTIANN